MTKKELLENITQCFDMPFVGHYIRNFSELITEENICFIESGGGATTKTLLTQATKSNGRVITIDLCMNSYKDKIPLFNGLVNNQSISKIFQYYNMDVYDFWNKVTNDNDFRIKVLGDSEKCSYYFDDACHESAYLIKVFKLVIPLCKTGAIIGSHDMYESPMRDFKTWMDNHPQLEFIANDTSTRVYKVK